MAEDGWGAGGGEAKPVNLDEFGDQNGVAESAGANGFDENGGPPGDDNCRNCGQEGHHSRDCTEPRQFSGECFKCGQAGHSKAECTNPEVFRGICKVCDKEGHRANDCPDKPPTICRNCGGEGHEAFGCTVNRRLDKTHVPDKLPEDAWAELKKASDERDLDDFKEAIQILSKAIPELTYSEIETQLRKAEYTVYLIAMEKEIEPTQTIVDLQGRIGCKYAISYHLSSQSNRAHLKSRWPKDPEENLKRLESCGVPMDSGVLQCRTCGELGHTSKACQQEKILVERVQVQCYNCDEFGHRVRDCKQERPQKKSRECKICESTEHLAKDCPDKPPPRTCRNCGSEEHMAKDCDKPRPCRNCDATDHQSRDCPKPKDWSRVTCNNCGESGHGVKRCKQPIKEPENDPDAGFSGFGELSVNDNTNNAPESAAADPSGEFSAAPSGGGGW